MEIKIINLLLLTILLVSCKQHHNLSSEKNEKLSSNRVYIDNGNYYQFNSLDDTSYRIAWGNKMVNNESIQIFDVLGSGKLNLVKSNDKVVILGQSCGSSCVYYVVLPFITGLKEKVFMQTIAYDINKNVVAYIPDDESFIRIENYLTGQKLDIKENNLCPAAFKGDCIDSSYFKNDSFIIKWQGSKWDNDKLDSQEKIIPIKFLYK